MDVLAQLGATDPFEASGFEADEDESYEAQQTGLFTGVAERVAPESGVRVLSFDDVNQADRATWSYLAFLCERSLTGTTGGATSSATAAVSVQ